MRFVARRTGPGPTKPDHLGVRRRPLVASRFAEVGGSSAVGANFSYTVQVVGHRSLLRPALLGLSSLIFVGVAGFAIGTDVAHPPAAFAAGDTVYEPTTVPVTSLPPPTDPAPVTTSSAPPVTDPVPETTTPTTRVTPVTTRSPTTVRRDVTPAADPTKVPPKTAVEVVAPEPTESTPTVAPASAPAATTTGPRQPPSTVAIARVPLVDTEAVVTSSINRIVSFVLIGLLAAVGGLIAVGARRRRTPEDESDPVHFTEAQTAGFTADSPRLGGASEDLSPTQKLERIPVGVGAANPSFASRFIPETDSGSAGVPGNGVPANDSPKKESRSKRPPTVSASAARATSAQLEAAKSAQTAGETPDVAKLVAESRRLPRS